ncbi:MAG: hypothetical protein JSV19_05225 [Phycisphaerales bacterium]|nr:MAG: hypothetical protein JSV19_05225 [Phycisphaerales bacterium]
MFLHFLRVVFVLALAAVGWRFIAGDDTPVGPLSFLTASKDLVLLSCLGVALVVIAVDIFIPRKSLGVISGLFFGLVVGMVISVGLAMIVDLVVESTGASFRNLREPVFAETPVEEELLVPDEKDPDKYKREVRKVIQKRLIGYRNHPLLSAIKFLIGVICCYLTTSFVLQTKDDVRFVIPYVEFAKQTKGARPLILDTSVLIDGRIADVAEARIFESEMIVPRFVLRELQSIADSGDKLKRTRGRRGLDMLFKLQSNDKIDVKILDVELGRRESGKSVDELLVELADQLNGRVMTNDYNLNKVAQVRGVTVINLNDLATALRPVFLPGEGLDVRIIRPGEEAGQGVGYLEDGTMVVAEGGRDFIGKSIHITVTSVLQSSAGRMIFGRMDGGTGPGRKPRTSRVT